MVRARSGVAHCGQRRNHYCEARSALQIGRTRHSSATARCCGLQVGFEVLSAYPGASVPYALSDLIRASRSTCCQQRTLARTLVLQVAAQRWWCARLAARASCCASASARSGQRHCRADLSSHVRVHVALTSTRQHATCQLGSIDNPIRPRVATPIRSADAFELRSSRSLLLK